MPGSLNLLTSSLDRPVVLNDHIGTCEAGGDVGLPTQAIPRQRLGHTAVFHQSAKLFLFRRDDHPDLIAEPGARALEQLYGVNDGDLRVACLGRTLALLLPPRLHVLLHGRVNDSLECSELLGISKDDRTEPTSNDLTVRGEYLRAELRDDAFIDRRSHAIQLVDDGICVDRCRSELAEYGEDGALTSGDIAS